MPARLLAAAAVGLALVTAAPADVKPCPCESADLRYPFQPDGPKRLRVFRLTVAGGLCPTAHRVAKAWMRRFEAGLR